MTGKRFHIETYGCQMNFSDSEIVHAILTEQGHTPVDSPDQADIIFVNTCSIRDNAEKKVWDRLHQLRALRRGRDERGRDERGRDEMVIGVLGCMAERVRERFLEKEKLVDIVVGPDAYRDIPNLLAQVDDGRKAVNVLLSLDETYADITPVRTVGNGVSAFVSIMRGCDNMCSFCVVPFTRGRERSRDMKSILEEVRQLYEQGYKEVTFLGQNVNSYRDEGNDFTAVMVASAELAPEMRFRFSSPHPKDFPDSLLLAIRDYPNLCNYIHIPAQSGSNSTLERMRRPYTREQYLELIHHMKATIPGLSLSTDVIAGFCGETDQEHQDTLSLMAEVRYDLAYTFAYSERERTLAARRYVDDVPEAVKKRRLTEIIDQQRRISYENHQLEIGRRHIVLVEGPSKRTDTQLCGRTDTNKMVVFDRKNFQVGQYVEVQITSANSATLMADPIQQTTIRDYHHAMVTA